MNISAAQQFTHVRNLIPLQERNDFSRDVIAFFKKRGSLGRWAYSSPLYPGDPVNGKGHFKEWVKDDPLYYVIRNEKYIFGTGGAQKFANHIGRNNIDVLADLGCGTEEAIVPKVFPLLQEFSNAAYAPIDINQDYVDAAEIAALSIREKEQILPTCADFMKDEIKLNGRVLALMLGGTITNFNGVEGVRKILSNIREMVGDNGHVIFTYDANDDGNTINRAYSGKKNQEIAVNIMHRIARDLGDRIEGDFDPTAWEYVEEGWEESTHTMRLCVTPTRFQEFSIDGESFKCEVGEPFEENSIFKMPREYIQPIAKDTGWVEGLAVPDQNNWITAQHLRAA